MLRRLGALALTVAVCVVPSIARGADPYEINVILPMTGPGAFLGQTHIKELTALQDVVNRENGIQGRQLKFVFHDDQTNPQVTVQLANKILEKKPSVVLGSSLGALCKAIQPLFANGPVNYCLSPVIYPEKNGFVFSGSISGYDLIVASLRYFRGRGWKRFATLNTTDASGQIADNDIATALKNAPEFKDMVLTTAEHFNPADTSTTAQVAKIKATNPQALLVWSPGTPFGTAMHGLQDVGLELPVMTTSANMVTAQLKQWNSFLPKQLYFQGVSYIAGVPHAKDTKPVQVWTTAIKSVGLAQDMQSGIVWDPAMIVVDALRKVGPDASPQQLHAYLEQLHGYTGISGVYDFRGGNQRGLTVDDALIMRWDGDKADFVTVSKYGGAPA